MCFFIHRSPCRGGSVGGGGLPYQRPNVVETKYIVKKNGPMGTSNQANAAASFFAKAHQKLQLNNNGLHDLGLRNNGGQGCSPASSRRFQVSLIMMFSTRVLNTQLNGRLRHPIILLFGYGKKWELVILSVSAKQQQPP